MSTAFIGGASRGIGFACAEALAERGHDIILCARDRVGLEKSAARLRSAGDVRIDILPGDLGRSDTFRAIREMMSARGVTIDVLVNNTGGPAPGKIDELSEMDWQRGYDALFLSTLRLYAIVLPGMRAQRFGRIINILSTAAVEPAPTLAISSVIRAALASYAKLTALAVAPDGITVNSIMPGALRTARLEQLERDRAEREKRPQAEIRAEIEAGFPMNRPLELSELGSAVAFLASREASGVSGQLLAIDGIQTKSL